MKFLKIFLWSFRSFQCIPKHEKCNQLSSPLTIDKEQRLSEHFNRSDTPTLKNFDEQKSNKINNDEHKQISSYTNQLAFINKKQGIQSQIRLNRYVDHQRVEKKLIIAKLEAENR